MGSVVGFVSHKEDNKGGNHDIRRHKRSPVEGRLERGETLDEQNEDVEEQVEAVDPDAAQHLEGEGGRVDALLLEAAADAQVREDDGGPGNVRRGASDRGHVGEDLAGGDADVHEGQEAPAAGGEDGHVGDYSRVWCLGGYCQPLSLPKRQEVADFDIICIALVGVVRGPCDVLTSLFGCDGEPLGGSAGERQRVQRPRLDVDAAVDGRDERHDNDGVDEVA